MKKVSVLLLVLSLVLTLTGCGGGREHTETSLSEQEKNQETLPAQTTEQETETRETRSEQEEASVPDTKQQETEESAPETEISYQEVRETVWAVSNVNIRKAAGTDSEVITVLRAGQSVERTGISDTWSRVNYEGMVCYISSAYLTSTEPESATVGTAANLSGTPGIGNVSGSGTHIVAIDAGHQAHGMSELEPNGPGSSVMKAKVSTGTVGVATGIPESVLNLNVALQLRDALVARGYQVVMIRETQDVTISNAERAAVANASGAEIFLRIHANGSANSGVSGIVTMCPSPSNPYVSYLYDSSMRLSSLLVNNMCAATGANNQGVLATDDMSGINWCTIPVSIIEMGYMSNPTEDVRLNSADYQALLVQGMVTAVDQYFGQ